MIIFRYIIRELGYAFLFTSIVLLLICFSTQFAHYLTLTASGKMISWQLFYLLSLEIPQLLTLILPLAFYLSILLTFGRLYGDSEIIILLSCGLSRQKLLAMTLIPATILVLLIGLMTLWLNPHIAVKRNQLLNQISALSILQTLAPEQFQSTEGGKKIFYIENISHDHQQLKNVFFADLNGKALTPAWTITTAKQGHYETDSVSKSHFIVVDDGNRYEGQPGQANFNLIHFDQYHYRIDLALPIVGENRIDSLSTSQLLNTPKVSHLKAMAELQWRLSLPLCIFILTLMAFSLAEINPRQGKFARFFPAILLYMIYANFMIVGQNWIAQGKLTPYLGLGLLHLIMLIIGLGIYFRRRT